MKCLPTRVRGQFLYLYLIIDIYSRKIVGYEVFESEKHDQQRSGHQRAVLREQCGYRPLVLHGDNGSAMKGSTVHAKLEELGVTPSHSRARVSNDNAYSESLFRICKYHPAIPVPGFRDLEAVHKWVGQVVQGYNHLHPHSEIRYVTPAQRHAGQDNAIRARRYALYQVAHAQHSARWLGTSVTGNPSAASGLLQEGNINYPISEVLEAA